MSKVRWRGVPTVLRIITRLNVGGPAIQAARLTGDLEPLGYRTVLLHGQVGSAEGSMADLLRPDAEARYTPTLRRELSPLADSRAFAVIWSALREFRPDIVHTHMAKAGLLGRLAAHLHNRTLARKHRARIVHTYHGHVLDGYFSPRATAVFIAAERRLSRWTDALVAVSPIIRDDLIERFGIGTRERFHVVPLGFDLAALAATDTSSRVAARRALDLPPDVPVIGTVGRLTAIKNHELFIDAARLLAARTPSALFLIVGDGERRADLEAAAARAGLAGRIRFLGWRRDLATVYGALDVFVLTSRNEGTPVALIEAMAAGVCGVATRVGGVPDVISDSTVGVLVPGDDPSRLADEVDGLLRSGPRRRDIGERARASVLGRYGITRLVGDIDRLYRSLLSSRY